MADPCEGRETHHLGCPCHEARRDAEVAALRAEVERLRADHRRMMDTCDAATNRVGFLTHIVNTAAYTLVRAENETTIEAARRVVRERDEATAEAERLRAEVATARREGAESMQERCAARCEELAEEEFALCRALEARGDQYGAAIRRDRAIARLQAAAALRALPLDAGES